MRWVNKIRAAMEWLEVKFRKENSELFLTIPWRPKIFLKRIYYEALNLRSQDPIGVSRFKSRFSYPTKPIKG